MNIAAAMKEIHSNQIAHCDMKPANVLLDVNNQNEIIAVLADFGVCRILNANELAVQAFKSVNVNAASIAYASPEALLRLFTHKRETRPQVWKAGDVYSFGVIVFELLSRRNAWRN
jgi:serine/threonine protein kinase